MPERFEITAPIPRGTTVLEASAGTGKTWTIAALVARFVTEGTHRLADLLVVTFGRAASQELRSRVRERLVRTERLLAAAVAGTAGDAGAAASAPGAEGPWDEVDHLLAGPGLPGAELRLRHRRLRHALSEIDAATIATIHQFSLVVRDGLGVAGDATAGLTAVESVDDLLAETVSDLYVSAYAHFPHPPQLTLSEAQEIARAVVRDPIAHLEPQDCDPRSAAGQRVRFAEHVRTELARRKERTGVLTYDDMLAHAARSLASPAARARLSDRWKVVLVDEFQDTDPLQWHILREAFHGSSDMILIGDPKQAIYAFRGGDVATYLEAAGHADRRLTLSRNHRGDQHLHEALQGLFGGAELGDPRIRVTPVDAGRTGGRTSGVPAPAPVRLRIVDPSGLPGSARRGVYLSGLRARIYQDLTADIARLLTSSAQVRERDPDRDREIERPVRAGDVAVLCTTNFQAERVQEALAAGGVHSVIASAGSVFATAAARDWLTLLESIELPSSSRRVRAVALTPFFGHTAAELDRRGEDLTDEVAERLRDWGDLLRRHGVAAVFETAQGWGRGGVSDRVLRRSGGQRLLTDLRHLAELLHDRTRRVPEAGVIALVHWLRERMAAPEGEDLRRLDTDDSAVHILTVHGSKGLEFPFVYLPTLAETFGAENDLLLFHDATGRRCLDVGGTPSPEHRDLARAEDAGQALRLLYVAATRARSHLVAWWMPSLERTPASPLHRLLFARGSGDGPIAATAPLPADPLAEAAERWGAQVHLEEARIADLPRPGTPSEQALTGARSWNRRIDLQWRRTSYTALSAAAEDRDWSEPGGEPGYDLRADEQEIQIEPGTGGHGPDGPDGMDGTAVADPAGPGDVLPSPMASLPRGARFGSLVHGVLEHLDPVAAGDDLRGRIGELVGEQLTYWPEQVDREVLVTALEAVVRTPLGPLVDPAATLADVPRSERLHELDFELPLDGGDRARARTGDTAGAAGPVTLGDLAPALRRHLGAEDPLAAYAGELDGPGYRATSLRGYLTGSIDVVFRRGGRFFVADYKTNWLGPLDEPLTSAHYGPAQLDAAMRGSSYPLQALLYSVALHRYLRWRLPGYDPAEHLGGVLYLYVRGMAGPATPITSGHPAGVFSWAPPAGLVTDLSNVLDGGAA
ncbi:UvrD-helicase domain-containing protein [Pseudactinotalea sp. HY158]|uniref:UvrD-helicase domain-containing protein n=1 Tax=Pseudactinotalea sp. HY158 TaxID=2654547 RepID=UPI00129D138F|nr:UvrD-helicase domain-containing protein [Pseudactinotalea sp. HY158]QGH68319.1 AAA family ATPase [Pseudactinotalea sp. HY158]